MADTKVRGCALRYTLTAQSPLIHFQHDQAGATLRATEVKPKLDKFLKKKVAGIIQKPWFIKSTGALNYKMRIVAESTETFLPPSIFYGNMGIKNEADKVHCVLGNCQLEILSPISELLAAIDTHIAEFFVCTNFGRMQNKGFGSFTVAGAEYRTIEIARMLVNDAAACRCYAISGFSAGDTESIFGAIKTLYSVMKSGINHTGFGGSYHRSFLFEYCHEVMGLGNEKAAMKAAGVSPWKDGSPVKHPLSTREFSEQNHEYKYVRALLGVGEQIEYIADFKHGPNKSGRMVYTPAKKEKISISNADIERLASPIFFKIIGGTVYIVAHRVHPDVFGKPFTFTNTETKKSITLPVPDQFDTDDFLHYFITRYNEESQKTERNGRPVSFGIGKKINTVYTKQGGND